MGDTYDTGETAANRIQQPTLRIEVQVVRYGGRGPVYRVLHAGQVLLAHSRCPLFEACRTLLAQGITGRLELWRPGEATFDVACDVELGARHTIAESETRSLQLAPWSSWDAVCRAAVEPRTATDVSSVPVPTPEQMPEFDEALAK